MLNDEVSNVFQVDELRTITSHWQW